MSITINYENVNFTAPDSAVVVTNGSFALQINAGLAISGTMSIDSLSVTSGCISFNPSSGTLFNGFLSVALDTGGTPTIEVTNVTGTVVVTWPTSEGLETHALTLGIPLTLNNYAG